MGISPEQADKNLLATVKDWCLRHPYWALTLATVTILVPFLARPFNVDEPLFVWAARQIQSHPADPFGFNVNWYGISSPMWEVMQNPPLMSYFLAAAAGVFGWSECALHFACWLPAVAVVLGTYRLAVHYCRWPLLAASITLFAPGFLTSSTTVMCDVTMLAFWVWAVVLWTEGIRQDNLGKLLAAGLLVALATFTKYNGICLLPLLAAHGWIEKRSPGRWAVFLLIPVAALGFHEWVTYQLYGHPHFLQSSQYARQSAGKLAAQHQINQSLSDLIKAFNTLTFAGGCFAFALFCSPWLWRKRQLLLLAVSAGLFLVLAVAAGMFARNYDWLAGGQLVTLNVQIWLWTIGGVGVLALAVAEAWEKRGGSLLLAMWVAGIFLFAAFFNWTVNARVLLPMAPAVAILIARRLEQNAAALPFGVKAALVACAALSLLVAEADYQLAIHARKSTEQVLAKYGGIGGTIWFEGHWGFQYYMQSAGARALDYKMTTVSTGDIFVIPDQNANLQKLDAKVAVLREVLLAPNFPWIATEGAEIGAGFYSQLAGPLPFVFGHMPPEKIIIYDFKAPVEAAH